MQQITDSIFVETEFPGCNTSIIATGEGSVVIDTPAVPNLARGWAFEAAKYNGIRYVINGEPHTDHVAGNCWFDAPVIAAAGVREWIASLTREDLVGELSWMAPQALPLDADFYYKLPEFSVKEELVIHLGKLTLQLMVMPGHTPFNMAVYVPEEKVLFTSDNVIEGMPIMVHCVPAWLDTLNRLEQFDVDYVVRGHGTVGNKSSINEMKDNLNYCFDAVKAAIDRGWNLDDACRKLTFSERFPPLPGDPMAHIRRMGITRLYEIFGS